MAWIEFEDGRKEYVADDDVLQDFVNGIRVSSSHDEYWTVVEVSSKKVRKTYEKLLNYYYVNPDAVVDLVKLYLMFDGYDGIIWIE